MIFTKEYLRGIPHTEKREAIEKCVTSIVELVLISAKTNNNFTYTLSKHPLFTSSELFDALRKVFPDCCLQYYRTNNGAEHMYIDWS